MQKVFEGRLRLRHLLGRRLRQLACPAAIAVAAAGRCKNCRLPSAAGLPLPWPCCSCCVKAPGPCWRRRRRLAVRRCCAAGAYGNAVHGARVHFNAKLCSEGEHKGAREAGSKWLDVQWACKAAGLLTMVCSEVSDSYAHGCKPNGSLPKAGQRGTVHGGAMAPFQACSSACRVIKHVLVLSRNSPKFPSPAAETATSLGRSAVALDILN